MNWKEIWMVIFGSDVWLGLDMGFWISLTVVVLVVIVMNAVFWGMKPQKHKQKS